MVCAAPKRRLALMLLLVAAGLPRPGAATEMLPSGVALARTACDLDGRCYETGDPGFRDDDDRPPPPRHRYDPDDYDRPPPPRRYDPGDDRPPPPPPSRRYYRDDDD